MKKISMLIPTFNESENVEPLSQAIINEFERLPQYDYEIVFIDNDSQDDTRDKIRKLNRENGRIKAIFNAKNFGQNNSPYYGLLQATGDCAILMCADFQDPVEMIPTLIEKWEEGYKIVSCIKTTSKENKFIRFIFEEDSWCNLWAVFEFNGPYIFHDQYGNEIKKDHFNVYIKIESQLDADGSVALISFHDPEFKMSHPYENYPINKE